MRHIRSFNESNNFFGDIKNVRKITEESLIYLLDDRFYSYHLNPIPGKYEIQFYYSDFRNQKYTFKWSDVKDDFIPYLHLLSESYKFLPYNDDGYPKGSNPINFVTVHKENDARGDIQEYYTLDQILNDEINVDVVRNIRFKIGQL